MKNRGKNVLWTLMAVLMLFAFAAAVPLGSLTTEAQRAYLDEAPVDDEYGFLFD